MREKEPSRAVVKLAIGSRVEGIGYRNVVVWKRKRLRNIFRFRN
jgi:hypothetical protein